MARILRPAHYFHGLVRKRQLHMARNLHFDLDQGLGDFLTPEGCKLVAVEFQNGLLDRINELIPGNILLVFPTAGYFMITRF
jgi:Fe-Mn family superoxide dismutase